MTQEAGKVFIDAGALKLFTLGQNIRIESWIAANWERAGMRGPVGKDVVSKALMGKPVDPATVVALDVLFDEINADPWEWCKPPTSVDDLSEYAPLRWWYDALHPPITWARLERINAYPLEGDDRELTQQSLDAWASRLRAACDQYKTDQALVAALYADENPEFQGWVVRDGKTSLSTGSQGDREIEFRRRVGNAGLHGRTPEEIGLAYALADVTITLPLIKEASLAYARPNVRPVHGHYSEPIEPWAGDAFEGVEFVPHLELPREFTDDEDEAKKYGDGKPEARVILEAEHKVVFYWDGSRYLVEDVEPFAQVREMRGYWRGEWRAPFARERDFLETGVVRKLWISSDEKKRDEDREVARLRSSFMRRLRRRKA